MENLLGVTDLYFDFVLQNQKFHSPEDFKRGLSDAIVNYWRMLLFVVEEDLDDAAKAEELLTHCITTNFIDEEKKSLQQSAQKQLEQCFPEEPNIDPEDEAQNRERRFLTFIAIGRFDDMDLL